MSTGFSIDTNTLAPLVLSAGAPLLTVADLVHQLGDIPLERIRLQPPPGTATLADVAECKAKQGCLCELVDGVLVEKAMGFREGIIELAIGEALRIYNRVQKLGVVTSASSMHQFLPNLVRLPDIGYTFWPRFPGGKVTDGPTPLLAPDLAVEVLSPSNTYGSTDEFGYLPVENPVHMHDLHATLLYTLGLDHERLTYRHAGRDFRLTDVYGTVVGDILI